MSPQEKKLLMGVLVMIMLFGVMALGMFMIYRPEKSSGNYRAPFKERQEAYIQNQKEKSKQKNVIEASGLHERSIQKKSGRGFSSY